MTNEDLLLVVDYQNDFITGSLPVQGALEILPKINDLMFNFNQVILTQDWHPPGHSSFKEWPIHCLQNTVGADFHSFLFTEKAFCILRKGMRKEVDSYSAFKEVDGLDTGLSTFLYGRNIRHVYICGLALDVCVKHTALHSAKIFDTTVITDACKGLSAINSAICEMKQAGVQVLNSGELHEKI
jgi:nicotinamidase/pyrazinamidase